jgi:helicase
VVTEDRAESFLKGVLSRARRRAATVPDGADGAQLEPAGEDRRLYWVKVGDPVQALPELEPGVDVRVLLPGDASFADARKRLAEAGVPFRAVPYWLESEIVTSVTLDGHLGPLAASTMLSPLVRGAGHRPAPRTGLAAAAARDAFELTWQAHGDVPRVPAEGVPARQHVPASWIPYLPYPELNPAQVQAAPHVTGGSGHVVVVAPTGAGKTVIGMMAALRAVLSEGRKAAWLVPQRSLTDELNRDLEAWRRQGLRVERLSGEYAVDAQRVRDADLWVATTEKFESICRTWSLREALAEVGCLVVDEIHLLGDTARGPVLEALLARVRGADSPVRIVGLSATIANAGQIAAWLEARLVGVTWRPSRLTWQLPVIPATSDQKAVQAARARLSTAIAQLVTADGGSVLVFCGSKRNVRATALAIAASRGADISRVAADDLDRIHDVCSAAGVGLHYKDWEHKREAEQAFRERRLDVLVATSTVAAGVNLPARAVVVRDTQVGLNGIDVALVQQMFGRAGRIGAGERDGWAYLITDENEHPAWQARLIAGYHVSSKILASLPDHVLAEAVQERVSTLREAEAWWIQTLAYHQGAHSLDPLHQAIDLLIDGGYVTSSPQDGGDADIAPTDLGLLTARLMIPARVGIALRTALSQAPVPAGPDAAESVLIAVVSVLVPSLAQAPVPEELRSAVARLLQAAGHIGRLGSSQAFPGTGLGSQAPYTPGDLTRASLLAVANSPRAFAATARTIAGIPTASMYPVLEEAPHYLHWIGAQGYLGTVPPWCAIVAADLSRRIKWRRCAPSRGSGRLLWMCEQMATPMHEDKTVPAMWKAATSRGRGSPDWPPGSRPSHCALDPAAYTTLLRDRLTGSTLSEHPGHVSVAAPAGAAAMTWTGRTYTREIPGTEPAQIPWPPPAACADADHGAALFSRRGDYLGTGWLASYQQIQDEE